MTRVARLLVAGFCLVTWSLAWAEDPDPARPGKPDQTPDQATLEKQFAETMSGASLVGFFTFTGREEAEGLKEEKYTLDKVRKLPKGDYWLFEARMQYGDQDLTVPLALEVKWAGDTPVITLTDLTIPGLGTFTARVLVYRGQYTGTWTHGEHGGHLFGRVVKEPADAGQDGPSEPDKPAQ